MALCIKITRILTFNICEAIKSILEFKKLYAPNILSMDVIWRVIGCWQFRGQNLINLFQMPLTFARDFHTLTWTYRHISRTQGLTALGELACGTPHSLTCHVYGAVYLQYGSNNSIYVVATNLVIRRSLAVWVGPYTANPVPVQSRRRRFVSRA